ncbi:MAG: SRPBCC domain-containing protein [Halioglobus sp.]|nr:SRPBCC domain-containing protein [Halioglobus sp.]
MKPGKTLKILVAVIVLLVGGTALLGTTLVPPFYTVNSTIDLPASQQESWNVLTDFERYPAWNPYLTKIEGVLAPGEHLSVTLTTANFDEPLTVHPTVGGVAAPVQFYWQGRVGFPGIYDTRHVFALEKKGDAVTTLHHYEEFRGLLAVLMPNREERLPRTLAAFNAMNAALQQELASRSPQAGTD